MSSVSLVPNREYCPNCFIKAVQSNPEKFKPGAVLEIFTAEQLINTGPEEQKVTFVFLSYCRIQVSNGIHLIGEPRPANDSNWTGMAGTRFGGNGLFGRPFEGTGMRDYPLDLCWFPVDENIFTCDIKAKTITYINENVISHFAKNIPLEVANLILDYVFDKPTFNLDAKRLHDQ